MSNGHKALLAAAVVGGTLGLLTVWSVTPPTVPHTAVADSVAAPERDVSERRVRRREARRRRAEDPEPGGIPNTPDRLRDVHLSVEGEARDWPATTTQALQRLGRDHRSDVVDILEDMRTGRLSKDGGRAALRAANDRTFEALVELVGREEAENVKTSIGIAPVLGD